MRILMTTDTVGGVWTFTQQLATEFLQRGHQIALVSFGRIPSTSQNAWCTDVSAAYGDAFCYTASEAPLEWMQNNEDAYEMGVRDLLDVLDSFAPEVFLGSQYCFGKLPVSLPKVLVAHSDVLSWAKSCRTAPLATNRWLHTYVRLVSDGLEGADAVVAPTHWMLTALAANFTLPRHAVVILNGRSLQQHPVPERKKLQAAAAGRLWDEAKNLALLDGFESPIPVLIAGSCELGPETATVHSPSVTLLGERSQSEVLTLFSESAIYICTSKYEPFGLAPLEAALCGCAVVANNIASLHEVWGDCALYFNDASSLKTTLQSLQNPLTLREAQSRSAARAALFTACRMAERYLNLFERLLHSASLQRSAHAA